MSAIETTLSVFVNDEPHSPAGGSTLAGLLQELGFAGRKGIAAAVNGAVVPRAQWPARALNDGDRVLLIRATQGG